MKQTLMLLNEEDWACSENNRNNDVGVLQEKDPIRNLATTMIMSGYNQMFDAPRLLINAIIKNWQQIDHNTDPLSIVAQSEINIINGKDFNTVFHWFSKEESDDVMSFQNCCDVVGISSDPIFKKIIFIKECRDNIVKSIKSKINPNFFSSIALHVGMNRRGLMEEIKTRVMDAKRQGIVNCNVISIYKPIYIEQQIKEQFKEKFPLERC